MATQLFDEWGFSQGHAFSDDFGYSDNKEHHFFDHKDRVAKGLSYFASSFPGCGSPTHTVATLDATPNYMGNYGSADTLVRMYGQWRIEHTTFAFLLCDPVQRAQSSFYHFKSWGDSFKEWSHRHTTWEGDVKSLWSQGLYDQHLKGWLERVGKVVVIPATTYYKEADVTRQDRL